MITASILEYLFITVTCCEEIAKELFGHRTEVCGHACFGVCIRIIAQQIPGLFRTKLIFQNLRGAGNFTRKIPGGVGTLVIF